MPYIKQEIRDKIDDEIDGLVGSILKGYDSSLDGVVNYAITRLMDKIYGEGGYNVYNDAIGVLECVKLEFYRRRVVPFEEWKIKTNGDAYYNREKEY